MTTKLPHRSENDLKNKWYSMMRKKQRSRSNPSMTSTYPGIKKVAFAEPDENKKPPFDGTLVRIGEEAGKLPVAVDPFASVEEPDEDVILPATVESRPFVKDTKLATLDGSNEKTHDSGFKVNYYKQHFDHEEDTKMSALAEDSSEYDEEEAFEPNFVPTRPVIQEAGETTKPSALN